MQISEFRGKGGNGVQSAQEGVVRESLRAMRKTRQISEFRGKTLINENNHVCDAYLENWLIVYCAGRGEKSINGKNMISSNWRRL